MLNYKFQTRGKSQISNNKSQTNPNIQIQMFKTLPFAFLREQWKEERKNVIPAEAGIYFYLTSDF